MSKTYSPMSMSEDSGPPSRLLKPLRSTVCFVVLLACLVVAVVIIVGLGIGLGITSSKLGDHPDECKQDNNNGEKIPLNGSISAPVSNSNPIPRPHATCPTLASAVCTHAPSPPTVPCMCPTPSSCPTMASAVCTHAPPPPTVPCMCPTPSGVSTPTINPSCLTPSPTPAAENICDSDSCRSLSSVVLSRMDKSFHPCVDFYNFTCGGFVHNAVAQGLNHTSSLLQVILQNYQQLSDILGNSFDTSGLSSLQKLKTLYDSCMDTAAIDSLGVQPLLDLIASTGGWDLVGITEPGSWSVNSDFFLKEKLIGSPALFYFGSTIDYHNSNKMIMEVVQSGLTFGAPEFYSGILWDLVFRDALVNIIATMLQRIHPKFSSFQYESAAAAIADFEESLAGIFVPTEDLYDVTNSYNVYTVGELNGLWEDYDWESGLGDAYATVGVAVDGSEPVNVATPAYFQQLHALISQTSTLTLKNYAKWQLVYQFSDHVDTETIAIMKEFKRIVFGKADEDRGTSCVQLAEAIVPLAMARVFVENLLPDGNTDSVGEIVNELKTALKERMNSLDWLDDFTRQRAKEKVDAITSRVGFPAKIFNDTYLDEQYDKFDFVQGQYFSNYLQYVNESVSEGLRSLRRDVDRSEYLDPPSAVNAYYFPSFNQITILSGIMASALFQTEWPVAYRYGGLGCVVGHEITHGFDNTGRQFNPLGNLEQWWTQTVVDRYSARTQCFVDQYNQYDLFGFGDLGFGVNGQATLGENIADNGGIKASYEAYNSAKKKYGEQMLPNLPYTSDQLFYIAWGQQWCELYDETSYIFDVLVNVHSPGPFRVIGSMVNNADFATAFDCPVGSPMNPESKCLLW